MVRLYRTGEDYRYRRRVDHFHCDGDDFFIELMVQLLQGRRLGISCGSENDINIGFRSELLDKTKSDTAAPVTRAAYSISRELSSFTSLT